MPLQTRNTLKTWFETGDKPTQNQFWDWLDSFFHQSDSIPQGNISGLIAALNGKVSQAQLNDLEVLLKQYADDNLGGLPFDGTPTTGQTITWDGAKWVPTNVGSLSKVYEEFENVSGLYINPSTTLPSSNREWRINLYRTGSRMVYLKDFTVSVNTIVLTTEADTERFTLIIE